MAIISNIFKKCNKLIIETNKMITEDDSLIYFSIILFVYDHFTPCDL